MTLIFFNLLVNSSFSLLAGLAVVSLTIWIFNIPDGAWKSSLLTIPFAKIIFDGARGIPANSVIASGIDPFTLPPKHQLMEIACGLSNWGPRLSFIFSTTALDGKVYAASIGDYLGIWLKREFGTFVVAAVVSAALFGSCIFILTRIFQAMKFERKRKCDRASGVSIRTIGTREIDLYTSDGFSGTPFTGGILKPYICIPRDAYAKLTDDELDAVILHELGHIAKLDLPINIAIQFLGDVFWFIPGYRTLTRKIDGLRELNADNWAVSNGANPLQLASALVKLKEIPEESDRFVLYSAFFRRKSLLKTRIETLLSDASSNRARLGWQSEPLRYCVFGLVFVTVMLTTFGGNQPPEQVKNPEWLEHILRSMGLS